MNHTDTSSANADITAATQLTSSANANITAATQVTHTDTSSANANITVAAQITHTDTSPANTNTTAATQITLTDTSSANANITAAPHITLTDTSSANANIIVGQRVNLTRFRHHSKRTRHCGEPYGTHANGCGRLRTVADGCERLRKQTQLSANTASPPDPQVKREPSLRIREKKVPESQHHIPKILHMLHLCHVVPFSSISSASRTCACWAARSSFQRQQYGNDIGKWVDAFDVGWLYKFNGIDRLTMQFLQSITINYPKLTFIEDKGQSFKLSGLQTFKPKARNSHFRHQISLIIPSPCRKTVPFAQARCQSQNEHLGWQIFFQVLSSI